MVSFFAFLHHVAAFALVAALAVEFGLIRDELNLKTARKLQLDPTLEFLSWGKAVKQGRVPDVDPRKLRAIRAVIHGELAGIVFLILFAALMARGVGYFG